MIVIHHWFNIVTFVYYNISFYLTWFLNKKRIIVPTIISLLKTIHIINNHVSHNSIFYFFIFIFTIFYIKKMKNNNKMMKKLKRKWKNDDEIKIKMKWMKNKLKSRLIQYNWKFKNLIKLWISLINQIKGLIA